MGQAPGRCWGLGGSGRSLRPLSPVAAPGALLGAGGCQSDSFLPGMEQPGGSPRRAGPGDSAGGGRGARGMCQESPPCSWGCTEGIKSPCNKILNETTEGIGLEGPLKTIPGFAVGWGWFDHA